MDSLLVLTRVLLSAVFVAAARTKLRDPQGTKEAAVDLGIPDRLASVASVLLPVTELAVAILLLPVRSASWGARAALTLLLVFTAVVAANLLLGRRPPCRCFGSGDTRPIGWRTLFRNGVLLAMATVIAWAGPGSGIASLVTGLAASEVVGFAVVMALVVAVAAQGWLIIHLTRQQGRLLMRLDSLEVATGVSMPELSSPVREQRDLPVGADAPEFRLPSLTGGSVGLGDLYQDGRQVMLVFLDPKCRPCLALVPDIDMWQRAGGDTLRIAVCGPGWEGAARAREAVSGLSDVLSDEDAVVSESYGVFVTPAALLIDPAGTIASRIATGGEEISALVSTVLDTGAAQKKA